MKRTMSWCALVPAVALAVCFDLPATAEDGRDAAPPVTARRMPCGSSEIERATCAIKLILADEQVSGIGVGSGGITSITAGTGRSYNITLPEEERAALITYEFVVEDGGLTINRRREATESY